MVIFEGIWMMVDRYVLVKQQRPFFQANTSVKRKLAVWINIPELPIQLYKDEIIGRVGFTLGVMFKIDQVTSIYFLGQFARICIEIDLDKLLQPKIIARGYLLNLQYENLYLICFKCDKYGYKDNAFKRQLRRVQQ